MIHCFMAAKSFCREYTGPPLPTFRAIGFTYKGHAHSQDWKKNGEDAKKNSLYLFEARATPAWREGIEEEEWKNQRI